MTMTVHPDTSHMDKKVFWLSDYFQILLCFILMLKCLLLFFSLPLINLQFFNDEKFLHLFGKNVSLNYFVRVLQYILHVFLRPCLDLALTSIQLQVDNFK